MFDANMTPRELAQAARDKARALLLAVKSNAALQKLFYANRDLSNAVASTEGAERDVTVKEYEISKLDEAHPLFSERLERAEKELELKKKIVAEYKEDEKKYEERVKEVEAYVAKIDAGEVKVMIDEVESLANELIRKA